MLKSLGWVAHVILVSAQVLLVLTLGPWTLDFGLGLDNKNDALSDQKYLNIWSLTLNVR